MRVRINWPNAVLQPGGHIASIIFLYSCFLELVVLFSQLILCYHFRWNTGLHMVSCMNTGRIPCPVYAPRQFSQVSIIHYTWWRDVPVFNNHVLTFRNAIPSTVLFSHFTWYPIPIRDVHSSSSSWPRQDTILVRPYIVKKEVQLHKIGNPPC
jgi:hypothetical protein